MANNLIVIKNLYVEYNTKKGIFGLEQTVHAVNGVSLDVQKGEILAIAGESGCGKSTLAKAIMMLVKSSNGSICLDDVDILNLSKQYDLKEYYKKFK